MSPSVGVGLGKLATVGRRDEKGNRRFGERPGTAASSPGGDGGGDAQTRRRCQIYGDGGGAERLVQLADRHPTARLIVTVLPTASGSLVRAANDRSDVET
jgi:hypothetical protein